MSTAGPQILDILWRLSAGVQILAIWGFLIGVPALLTLKLRMSPAARQSWLETILVTFVLLSGAILARFSLPSEREPSAVLWLGGLWALVAIGGGLSVVAKVARTAIAIRRSAMVPLDGKEKVYRVSNRAGLPELSCFGSRILVGEEFLRNVGPAELSCLLHHEQVHQRHFHWHRNLLCELLAWAVWWHPVCWIITCQLAELREMECDDAAKEGNPLTYAQALLNLARPQAGFSLVPAFAKKQTARWARLAQPIAAERATLASQFAVMATFAISGLFAAAFLMTGRIQEGYQIELETHSASLFQEEIYQVKGDQIQTPIITEARTGIQFRWVESKLDLQ